jgi:surface antigen
LRRSLELLSVFAVALALAAAPAAAQSPAPLLGQGPAERFTKEDNRLFREAWRKALDEAPENQPLTWENPENKHGGELTVTRSFEWQEHRCREVRVRNQADGRKSETLINACRVDGKWRLVSESQLKKK